MSEKLQLLISAMNWLRYCLPWFAARNFFCRSNNDETQCFLLRKDALKKRMTLAHRDHLKTLAIYNDAYDTHWSGFAKRVTNKDTNKPYQN